jgi:nitrate/nitrite-specific signal transduction histidine kinase
VVISLLCQPAGVSLEIRDDGLGFEPGEASAEHLGLRIMKERAADMGADFSIQSRPGQGATVSVFWKPPENGTTYEH